jgi:S-formylglutathione hydrolase FrmB
VKSLAYNLMGRVEESFSFYADWTAEGKRPGKEETIEAAKRIGHCRLWLRC